jgi:hypothetical protein
LLLVAVCEGNVNVLEREFLLRELLEAENIGVLGGILHPRSFFDERSADLYYYDRLGLMDGNSSGRTIRSNLGEFLVCLKALLAE